MKYPSTENEVAKFLDALIISVFYELEQIIIISISNSCNCSTFTKTIVLAVPL